MNRYFLRLPYSQENQYRACIIAVLPDGRYYWVRRGELDSSPREGLTEGDRRTLLTRSRYLELHSSIDPRYIVNLSNVEPTASAWIDVLAYCTVVPVPFSAPKATYRKLHTNHKIGAPKGKLP